MRTSGNEYSSEELMRKLLSATPTQKQQVWDILTNPKPALVDAPAKRNTNLYSLTATAKMLSISRNSLYSLIRQGRLDEIQIGGAPKITGQSLDELLSGKRPANDITRTIIAESKARYQAAKGKAA